MNRRSFLVAAPAIAAASPVVAFCDPTTSPIMRLFRDYQRLIEAGNTHACADDNELDELDRLFFNEAFRIEAQMMALPCTCAADFAAKVIAGTSRGYLISEWNTGDLWREARALVGAPDFMVTS